MFPHRHTWFRVEVPKNLGKYLQQYIPNVFSFRLSSKNIAEGGKEPRCKRKHGRERRCKSFLLLLSEDVKGFQGRGGESKGLSDPVDVTRLALWMI